MKTPIKNFIPKYQLIMVLIIVSLSLTACAEATQESLPEKVEEVQTDIFIPAVASDTESNIGTEAENNAYPVAELETLNSDISESSQGQAYPETELADHEEEPRPTPRGNELVATDPSTVILASGQLQLVELFAFW